jgi:hypothetical protein
MWASIIQLVAGILPIIPSLVTDAENIFRAPSSGPTKAAQVIAFVTPLIETATTAIVKLAPAGSDQAKIAASITAYTKAVNDATVALANDLGIFPHTTTPAAVA